MKTDKIESINESYVIHKKSVKSEEKPVFMVKIMYKYNNKFDLHIGREMKTFRGRETKEVPESWLQHKDFESVKKYFVVKGA